MKNLIPLILLIPYLISCRTPRYSYAPARVNVPLLSQKNETQLDGSISMLPGFDASGAYAVTSHVGIMLNGSWRNDHTEGSGNPGELLNPEKIQYHRSSADLGIGYFTPINSSQWYFECFGGVGTGKFSMRDNGIMNSNVHY